MERESLWKEAGDPNEEPQAEVWGESIPGSEQPGQGCKVGTVLVCLRDGKKASALQPASWAEGGDGAGGPGRRQVR